MPGSACRTAPPTESSTWRASSAFAKNPQQRIQKAFAGNPLIEPQLTQIDLSYVRFTTASARDFIYGFLQVCPHLKVVRVARGNAEGGIVGMLWSEEDDLWLWQQLPNRPYYPVFEQPEGEQLLVGS